MAGVRLATLVRSMRRNTPAPEANSDADLLARFVRDRDEAAFELLVWRYGAAVLAACERVLHNEADAEDAFQAAFLVLARKAWSISRGTSLPAWLHRVATRFALRIATSRRPATSIDVQPAAPFEPSALEAAETQESLDREIERLPEKQRSAVVLVYLNGMTAAEAARSLGVPTGTIESRLAAARRVLKSRLTARDIAPLTSLVPAAMAPSAAATTARAATAFLHQSATDVSAIIRIFPVHLAREAIHMGRLRTFAALAAFLGVVAIAAGAALRTPDPVETAVAGSAAPPLPDAPKPPDDPRLKPEWWGEALELGTLGKSYSYFQALSPDGKRMLVQHHGELLCVDIPEARTVWSIEAKGLWNAVYSPDGKTIAAAQWENGANLYDAETGKALAVFVAAGGGGERPDQVGFLPDGKVVVHTSVSSYRVLKDEPPLPDGSPKIASSLKYSLIVWDPATKKEVRRTAEELTYGNSNQWQWMKGGSQILQTLHAWSDNGVTVKQTLTHLDPRTGKKSAEIEIDKSDERTYDMSPDGKTILLVKGMEGPRLVDAATGKLMMKLGGHRAFVTAGAYSPDGKLIATVSGTDRPRNSFDVSPDGPAELLIRDTVTGEVAVRFEYQPSKYDFTKVGFSPDGKVVYAVTKNHKIVVWGRLAFPRPAADQWVGMPKLSEPPEPDPFTGRVGGFPSGLKPLVLPVSDTLKLLVASLPKSGRTTAQQIDALYTAALGRLPTPAETKTLQTQLGANPTPEKLKAVLDSLVTTPEFLKHVNSLINRVNGKDLKNIEPLVPNLGLK